MNERKVSFPPDGISSILFYLNAVQQALFLIGELHPKYEDLLGLLTATLDKDIEILEKMTMFSVG